MLAAIREAGKSNSASGTRSSAKVGQGKRILIVDHEDSFVHTLANYFKQTGAEVTTVRTPLPEGALDQHKPDLVVLSPGPGSPEDFDCTETIKRVRARDIPIFGVCLGLQALAQAYGGKLNQLTVPMHGKPSRINVTQPGFVFSGLDSQITIGLYHSIFADPATLPEEFFVSAQTEDGVIMAIQHTIDPVAAVQFHPESIMSLGGDVGMRMIENVVAHLTA